MSARPLRHIRRNILPYGAIFLAVTGGSYAIAAGSGTHVINGCVVHKTGELLVKARCGHGQSKLSWNNQGPQGVIGPAGAAGQAPPSAWALVSNAGQAQPTDGITATHVSTGTYQITVTAPACAGKENAPVVTVSDGNPPSGQASGAFPEAWVAGAAIGPFTVYTGNVVNGTFTSADHTFNIQDVCG
ncbi:MAG: hypothetical protein ACYDHH_33530 [Solirubrobacteraceae bacterium]